MTKKTNGCAPAQAKDAVYRPYSPDLLHQMQALLAALADLEGAFGSDLVTIQSSKTPEVIKQEVMRTLQHQHQERRAVLERDLQALHRRAMTRV